MVKEWVSSPGSGFNRNQNKAPRTRGREERVGRSIRKSTTQNSVRPARTKGEGGRWEFYEMGERKKTPNITMTQTMCVHIASCWVRECYTIFYTKRGWKREAGRIVFGNVSRSGGLGSPFTTNRCGARCCPGSAGPCCDRSIPLVGVPHWRRPYPRQEHPRG